jgi:hypothetical protein
VSVCPAQGALQLSLLGAPQKPRVPAWALAAGIALVFIGSVSYAKFANAWQTHVPEHIYQQLVPDSDRASHPEPGD